MLLTLVLGVLYWPRVRDYCFGHESGPSKTEKDLAEHWDQLHPDFVKDHGPSALPSRWDKIIAKFKSG